uniref:DNA repair protein REV1 n=1 Tax=Glossina austeni TaxID=7395 RepID=A0A1A9V359_GLOAU
MNNGFDEWGGYMEAKITKLEEQFSNASNPFKKTDLFAGISIFVNGLTNPSADELKRIMMIHGGVFHHYERSHTSFIIAENLPDVKVRNLNTSKIISPKWVARYLLYTNQKTSQPSTQFSLKQNTDVLKQSSATESDPKEIQKQLTNINQRLVELNASSADCKTAITSNTALTAVDPKFLNEFFNNSRLHHIATLGAGFKQYISELRQQHNGNGLPARQQLKEKFAETYRTRRQAPGKTCIMHIDMDCFFVSVGLRKHPHLRGYPVAVTHSKGGSSASEISVNSQADRQAEMELFEKRFKQQLHSNTLSDKVRGGFQSKLSLSEIASASYEARAKGIYNGMFAGQALILCPELKTIPYDFEGYREVAFTLYNTIAQYTLDIEAVSCDEMFVDLTEVLKFLQIPVMDFVKAVREEVKEKTGCPCSAGVGANKLQARMATKKAKPDGQYYLESDNLWAYMSNISIEELPGVGSSTAYTLKEAELTNCGDLQKCSLSRLKELVGKKLGETLYQFCRGIDPRPLAFEQIRKSISAEVNYGIRFKKYAELEIFLKQLSEEVTKRLKDIKRKTKCLTLKLMIRAKDAPKETSKFMGHGVCDHITKSVHLSAYTDDLEIITRTTLTTMKSLNLPPAEMRGIGIQLTKLDVPNEFIDGPKENVIKQMFSKVKEKQKELTVTVGKGQEKEKYESFKTIGKENVIFPIAEKRPKTSPEKKGIKKARTTEIKDRNRMPDVINMLKNNANKTRRADKQIIPNDVDPEVFNALPLDIKNEILKERGYRPLTEKRSSSADLYDFNESDLQPSTSKAAEAKRLKQERITDTPLKQVKEGVENCEIDNTFLDALPMDLRAEIEEQMIASVPSLPTNQNLVECSKEIIPRRNIFHQDNCQQLLLAWIESTEKPENYDIELICHDARELIICNELDKLYSSLLYMIRLLNGRSTSTERADCLWHAVLKLLQEAIDKEMRVTFNGRKLHLPLKLKCDKCASDGIM